MKKLLALTLLATIALPAFGCVNPSLVVTLEADKTILASGGKACIECHTTGTSDELSYLWLSNGGKIKGKGASIEWTAPDEVGDYVIAVEVIENTVKPYTATTYKPTAYQSSISITVRENHPPTISELKVSEEHLMPGGSYPIECLASDVNDDALTYAWEAEGGTLNGEGPSITWIAPNTVGSYKITVTVTDEMGAETTRFISLNVEVNHAPEIEKMEVAAEHKYLNDEGDYYEVGKGKVYFIGCEACDEDGDSLIYTWSWDRGNLQGSGSTVTWIAPNSSCTATIAVTVSDGRGGAATQDIILEVVSCSSCTF